MYHGACEALNGADHTTCKDETNQTNCEATEDDDVNGEDCQWRGAWDAGDQVCVQAWPGDLKDSEQSLLHYCGKPTVTNKKVAYFCAEDKTAVNLWKLVVTDFLLGKLIKIATYGAYSLVNCIATKRLLPHAEYNISNAIIEMLYTQGQMYIVLPFFPFLALMAPFLLIFNFKFEQFFLRKLAEKPSANYSEDEFAPFLLQFYNITMAISLGFHLIFVTNMWCCHQPPLDGGYDIVDGGNWETSTGLVENPEYEFTGIANCDGVGCKMRVCGWAGPYATNREPAPNPVTFSNWYANVRTPWGVVKATVTSRAQLKAVWDILVNARIWAALGAIVLVRYAFTKNKLRANLLKLDRNRVMHWREVQQLEKDLSQLRRKVESTSRQARLAAEARKVDADE